MHSVITIAAHVLGVFVATVVGGVVSAGLMAVSLGFSGISPDDSIVPPLMQFSLIAGGFIGVVIARSIERWKQGRDV